jgi:hypothetical protein
MYGIAMSTPQQFGQQIAVTTVLDLEYLVKESELLTGRSGRAFQLRSGSRTFTYQVTFDGAVFGIVGPSADGLPVSLTMGAREIKQSQFGIAMKEFRLFCQPLAEKASCR